MFEEFIRRKFLYLDCSVFVVIIYLRHFHNNSTKPRRFCYGYHKQLAFMLQKKLDLVTATRDSLFIKIFAFCRLHRNLRSELNFNVHEPRFMCKKGLIC